MNTKSKPHDAGCACHLCKIPPFCRNHYYTGRLLTAHDFTAEQKYHDDKHRLHNVALHGCGVVCGLKIRPYDKCPDKFLVLEPGIAIDNCGREIRVTEEHRIDLCEYFPPPQKPAHCEPDPKAPAPGPCDKRGEEPPANPDGPGPRPCPCPEESPSFLICIRYLECKDKWQPAPFDECGCHPDHRQPGVICEHYQIVVKSIEKPEDLKDCGCHDGFPDDCRELYCETLEGCPETGDKGECLPLAVVSGYTPGADVRESMINLRVRRILPSTATLDKIVRCILKRLPTRRLTRVADMNWTHGSTYRIGDFIKKFVGNDPHCKPGHGTGENGFDVTFTCDLFKEKPPLTTQIFEPMVLRQHRESDKPSIPEIAPAKVTRLDDRTIRLRLDPKYAEELCRCTSGFILFLRIRCNFLLDANGEPVDGNLFAHLAGNTYVAGPSTGDGIPGGLFESWITVSA